MEQELSTGEGFINSESYKRAGVDIDAGNALVEAIKPLARTTARPGADSELGGFGGLFDLKAAGFDDLYGYSQGKGLGQSFFNGCSHLGGCLHLQGKLGHGGRFVNRYLVFGYLGETTHDGVDG